jgi:hypothetical protein
MTQGTAPVTGLVLNIDDDGSVWLSAADWSAEGHLWAIERRRISISTLRTVAEALGPDAVCGVEARLRGALARQRQLATAAEAALVRAREAQSRVRALETALLPPSDSAVPGGQ